MPQKNQKTTYSKLDTRSRFRLLEMVEQLEASGRLRDGGEFAGVSWEDLARDIQRDIGTTNVPLNRSHLQWAFREVRGNRRLPKKSKPALSPARAATKNGRAAGSFDDVRAACDLLSEAVDTLSKALAEAGI